MFKLNLFKKKKKEVAEAFQLFYELDFYMKDGRVLHTIFSHKSTEDRDFTTWLENYMNAVNGEWFYINQINSKKESFTEYIREVDIINITIKKYPEHVLIADFNKANAIIDELQSRILVQLEAEGQA